MKVKELIEQLQRFDEDTEVRYTLLNMIGCADLLCQLFRIRGDN